MTDHGRDPVVVVGAGLAGLASAGLIHEANVPVVVLEATERAGGRMATWRSGTAVCDTGAQFFTVRSEEFRRRVEGWLSAGLVEEWCRGFGEVPDGYPRYAVRRGMDQLPAALARDLDVRTGARVVAVRPASAGWQVDVVEGELSARAVVVALPVPDATRLVPIDPPAIEYDPTLAVVAVLDGPSAVPPPGGVQLEVGPFSFVADNLAKGISEHSAVTLHASHATSTARWAEPDHHLLGDLLGEARMWLGDATVLEAQLIRWPHATPRTVSDEPCLVLTTSPAPLVLAGDVWAGPRVEGAFMSGLAAAAALLGALQ